MLSLHVISQDCENHWTRKEWLKRDTFKAGTPNVIYHPSVNRDKIISPPFHIKLGLMKSFVKV